MLTCFLPAVARLLHASTVFSEAQDVCFPARGNQWQPLMCGRSKLPFSVGVYREIPDRVRSDTQNLQDIALVRLTSPFPSAALRTPIGSTLLTLPPSGMF